MAKVRSLGKRSKKKTTKKPLVSSKSALSSSKQTPAQILESAKSQLQNIQSNLNKGIANGTIKSSSASKTPVSTPTTKTPAQILADAKTQLQGIQKGLNESVASGQFKTSTQPTAPTPLTPESITEAVKGATPEKAEGYVPAETEDNQITNQMVSEGQLPVSQMETQQQGFTGSQGGQVQQGNMQTPSIVDYLGSVGQPTDFNSRKALAAQYGIQGYTGTAQQNTQLLGAVRGAPVTPQEQVTPTSAGGITQTAEQKSPTSGTAQSLATMGQKFGLTSTQDDFFNDPLKTISTITQQVFKSMGLDQANSAITDISDELEGLENDRDDEIRAINDDPWLTEGVRLRQIQKIEAKWADRIDSRVNKLQLLESVRDDAQQQAQFALGTAISIYDSERKFQADQIQQYYQQAQNEFDNMIKLQSLSAPDKGTSEMQEYLFSVEQGFQGGFLDYKQAIAAAGRAPSSASDGLTPAQINSTVNSIAGAFDNEPIVKQYNNISSAYNTIQSIGVNTKNPADDINFIYAFAKIMDPESVVREGEYATIQKYAQSWASTFGFNSKRVFSNTNFLSPQAKQQMLNTLEPKVQTVTNQYNNLYNSYQQQIEGAYTGQPRTLTNYAGGNQPQIGPVQTQNNYSQETSDIQFEEKGILGKVFDFLF